MSTEGAPSQFTVAIVPLGEISDHQIKFTANTLRLEFSIKTKVLPPIKIPSQYFNAERNRYDASQLLGLLFFQLPTDVQRIMGIIDGGLEKKDGNPSFGYADRHHRTAIYSVPHLPKEDYNENDQDFLSRCYIIHEFIHTLGVKHCIDLKCVMNENPFKTKPCNNCRKWVDRELKVLPGSAEERFALAESFFLYNHFHQAIPLYREAITLAPLEPLYYHCLGAALERAGHFKESDQKLSLAAAHSNDYPKFYYNFGLISLRQNPEKAEDYFAKALAVTKNPQKLQKLIGQAYREIRHDVEQAGRHYKEYLRLGGDDPDVVEWLISRGQMEQS